MTDEQNKPVRSRDEQVAEIVERVTDLSLVNCYPDFSEVHDWIIEAEARGVAEQRRKGGEGQEPYAWGDVTFMMKDRPFTAYLKPPNADPEFNIPLYTHPANVAALEDRVRELEGVISAMRPGSVRTTIHSPTRFMDDTRAALTRTGTPS